LFQGETIPPLSAIIPDYEWSPERQPSFLMVGEQGNHPSFGLQGQWITLQPDRDSVSYINPAERSS
jgi:hypothetical protein